MKSNQNKSEEGTALSLRSSGEGGSFFSVTGKTGKRFRESFTNIEGNKRKLQKPCEKYTKFECSIWQKQIKTKENGYPKTN